MQKVLRGLSVWVILASCLAGAWGQPGQAPPMSRALALQALAQPSPAARHAGVLRLGEIGSMADADPVVLRLHDADDQVREASGNAMWQIWSRSGDKAIDAEYQKGVLLMEAGRMGEALAAFSAVIQKRPAFAEAWNKRATVYYLVGELGLSLKDCDEVMTRNPHHFGALSGYGQIYLQLGELEQARDYFERALKVNPNLPGAVAAVEALQRQLGNRRRQTI